MSQQNIPYIHTYIHTYIPYKPYIHTYIHTSIHTNHKYIQYIIIYIHTYRDVEHSVNTTTGYNNKNIHTTNEWQLLWMNERTLELLPDDAIDSSFLYCRTYRHAAISPVKEEKTSRSKQTKCLSGILKRFCKEMVEESLLTYPNSCDRCCFDIFPSQACKRI